MRVSISALMLLALMVAGRARAQVFPADNRECVFPIRSWTVSSVSMVPTISAGQKFWAICTAHVLRNSVAPEDSLVLAAGDHTIRPGDLVLVQMLWGMSPGQPFTIPHGDEAMQALVGQIIVQAALGLIKPIAPAP